MSSYDHDNPGLARTYDRVSDSQFEGGKRLLERLELPLGAHVLDVGCGTGRLSAFIAERVGPAGSVVGIDPLPERVALASAHSPQQRFVVGSAEDLGVFADESFDIVCLNAVFHWIADKAKALAEIRRVLRPGGRVGCTTSPRELYWQGTMPSLCASVFARSPYLEALDLSAVEIMNRQLTTTEILSLLIERQLELIELHVLRRTQVFAGGQDVVDFADASSFGNFSSLVPEALRAALRADLAATFEQLREPEGIKIRQHGTLFIAERKADPG